MALNLGSTADVRRITGVSSNQVVDDDVVKYLEEADRLIRAEHFQQYMSDVFFANPIRATGNTNKVYQLFFPIKAGSTPSVIVNGVTLALTTDYTIAGNIITFTSSYNLYVGDRVVVYYTPEFFDDYANWIAADRLFSNAILDSSNGALLQNKQYIKDNVLTYRKMAMSKPHMAASVDHYETGNLW